MPFIGDREVSEDEYQAALKEAATQPKDDRIIYLAVRYRGKDGVFVEGGYNTDFDFLEKPHKEFALKMAFEALVANGLAMFPDDASWAETLEEHTDLGAAGGPRWRDTPPTPSHTEGATHGDDDQAERGDHSGEPGHSDSGAGARREGGETPEGA